MQSTKLEISAETAVNLGLSEEEFERIEQVLGRTPNFTELSVFSAMWSEQCSQKNSISLLNTLPREGRRLLEEEGEENERLIDIGEGLACVLKVKPLNCPPADQPQQVGVAGNGNIHQEIFETGARPIAVLSSFQLGNPDLEHTQSLIKEVVKSFEGDIESHGVPNAGAKFFFSDTFNQNTLASTMSVGLVKAGETVSARAYGLGNPVYIVGAAKEKREDSENRVVSENLTEEASEEHASLFNGDFSSEKRLLEASLEAIKTGAVSGMQSIGAAGIARSTSEMSAKSSMGMVIHLDKVPTEREGLKDWEVLLAESQGRMLIVGKVGEELLFDVFDKWNLKCVQIGEVTADGLLQYFSYGEKVAEIPAFCLVRRKGAPVYERKVRKPAYLKKLRQFNRNKVKSPKDLKAAAKKLMASPNLCSKRWVFEQSLSSEPTSAPSDAAVVNMEGSSKSLVLTMDCNPNYVHADPCVGAMIAVSEAARNIICSGGVPVAITNCLNFGSPYDPEVYYQFEHVIKGIRGACRKFRVPVTDIDVSFFNPTMEDKNLVAVPPTPVIGMLGILEKPSHRTTLDFKDEGDIIYMIGNAYNDIGSSEYLRVVHGIKHSPAPVFDLHDESEIHRHVRNLILEGKVKSAHDVSLGGLFANLIESAIVREIGFNVETVETFRKDCFLFGESQSRIVISLAPEDEDALQNYLINNNVSFTKLGEVIGTEAVINEENFGSVSGWKRIYDNRFIENNNH